MSEKEDTQLDLRAGLERRFYAALIDMVIVAGGCFAVMQAGSTLLPVGIRGLRGPAMILIGAIILLEALSGRSIGKLFMRLAVRDREGGWATVFQKVGRTFVRWFAPLVALASMVSANVAMASVLLASSIIVVICEVPACYITYFRVGGSVFDLITRTRVDSI